MQETLIPSALAYHVKENLVSYLNTTFNIKNAGFAKNLEDHIRGENGLFRGPYIDIKLPFKAASNFPTDLLELTPQFIPFAHQVEAFKRITSKGKAPQNTLVVTGTGSGKTECFLIPVLDHCLRNNKKSGVKVIILYPMNALAFDQARRIAEIVNAYPELRDQVTAGILVGEDRDVGEKRITHKAMGSDHLIDDRKTIIKNPPDILLTNYKMLDLLLMKPEFKDLWNGAVGPYSSMQYLVLDEMHTYDGAQGSDVSLLIRRLKAKLQIENDKITCVGTSATLLSGLEGSEVLRKFAGRLFGVGFDKDSIIKESRETIDEVFFGVNTSFKDIPNDSDELEFKGDVSLDEYALKQSALWFKGSASGSYDLGQKILSHSLAKDLLKALDGKPQTEEAVLKELDITSRQLYSFLSLIAHATKEVSFGASKRNIPLFFVRVQLWIRELRRLLSTLDYNSPKFKWLEEKSNKKESRHLPPVFCEECGELGYLVSVDRHQEFEWDIQKIYEKYAQADSHVRYLFPWRELEAQELRLTTDSGEQMTLEDKVKICPECGLFEYATTGEMQHDNCPACSTKWNVFRKWASLSEEKKRDKRQCPSCDSRDSLRLLASRGTTLTSIVNGQLFLSKLNPQNTKKLLVFSDSVQDASHRAGYYNARTFRFNFRTAIQSYLSTLKSEPLLIDVASPFLEHWKKELGEDKAAATFCPSDLAGLEVYEDYFEKKKKTELWDLLLPRTLWELYLEYSLRSQVGRTLEKTLSSAAYIAFSKIEPVIQSLFDDLSNHHESVRQAGLNQFKFFVLGILERTLIRGSIGFEFFKDYRYKESAWELDKKKAGLEWISRLPKGRLDGSEVGALPKFISFDPDGKIFDYAGTIAHGDNWFTFWFKKNFLIGGNRTYRREDITPLYRSLFEKLEQRGIFNSVTSKRNFKNFGINPELIRLTNKVVALECDSCAHKTVVPADEVNTYLGLGCVITHCKGHFSKTKVQEKSFYRDIYESGDIERIFAREHTGLLGRKRREDLEIEFKESDLSKRRPDSANLLSCTPTLEMGIDIGDLSATVVGALPKSSSNYQQQIGRAGRKSGSAFVVAIAQSRPRDLLYFRYPEELIAGNIEPPGCFLDAPDILRRQFFAYLFDQHYADLIMGIEKLSVTGLRKEVREASGAGFIKNFNSKLLDSSSKNLENFKSRFNEEEVSQETWAELTSDFSPKSGRIPFVDRLKKTIEGFNYELNQLDHLERSLKEKISPFEEQESKGANLNKEKIDEFRDLKREKATLEAQKELLGSKDGFFEFLTHYGFLPNYAFHEDSVELVGLILDESKESGKKISIKHRETFDRPAKIALRELAPMNTFYGGGYKLQIDQIDVGGKTRTLIEDWRVCRACGHLARDSKENQTKNCPRCSDLQWGDRGALTKMLKLHRAVALETAHSSQIGDEAEDRQKKFFKVRPFFDYPKSSIKQAWACSSESFVFGIEFLSRMTLREINFGSEENLSADKIEIAGEELPRGFHICHECGRVAQQERDGHEKIHHMASCKFAKTATSPDARKLKPSDPPVMLYRELQSEAIRVLLPVSEFDADVRTASIRAAFMLGFIKKFGGKPIHLEIGQQRILEPGEERLSKRYLVIFDSVPGGTGFLRELWNKDSFFDMIEMSLKTMTECSCSTSQDLDGCPRCILAGATQYDLSDVSKQEAVKYLEQILKHKKDMKELDGGLDAVEVEGFLDSDLEYRFLALMRNLNEREMKEKLLRFGVEVTDVKVSTDPKGDIEFSVKKKDSENIASYKMKHQKVLNSGTKETIADFYIERTDTTARPIAIYLDGFRYHAGPQTSDRLTADFVKREALFNGDGVDRHTVWNMNWKDIETFEREPQDHPARYFDLECTDQIDFLGQNPMIQLFRVLAGEIPEKSFTQALRGAAQGQRISPARCSNELIKTLEEIESTQNVTTELNTSLLKNQGTDLTAITSKNDECGFSFITKTGSTKPTSFIYFKSPQSARETALFYENWERLLYTFNILQLISSELIVRVWAEE